jgi:6-phosphogluconolactonase (cycloisomerase 2 family)
MKAIPRLALVVGAALALSAWIALPASADEQDGSGHADGADHVVFVQTDNTAGNQVVAYDRADDGTLTLVSTYATGGLGGVLNGSVVDHLGSQGSLAYDPKHALLFAVNAGSDTVTVFSVHGDQLALNQVLDSGGSFPVSIAVHDGLVYVLNAENGGSVTGFRVAGHHLRPLHDPTRSLGLMIPSDATQFTHTPGQVAFSPDGSQLLLTTKAASNAVDVFSVSHDGSLSDSPVVNTLPGAVPFAITFDQGGQLGIGEAGPSALATFVLNGGGTITQIDALANGQPGLCWVEPAGDFFYTGNTASNSTSGYQIDSAGDLTLLGATATNPGTVDGAATQNGEFLYVQTGGQGIVDEFHVNNDGTLTPVGSVSVTGAAGGEGIVAS